MSVNENETDKCEGSRNASLNIAGAKNEQTDIDTQTQGQELNVDYNKPSGSGVVVYIDGAKSPTVNVQATVNKNTSTETADSSNTRTETRQQNSLASWFRSVFTTDTSHCALKCRMQQLYKNLTLAKVAWLDKEQGLPMDYFVNLQLNQSNEIIPMKNLFNRVKSGKPMRILIEGQPGFGKTTLTHKLAYDWATNKRYINHFNLVFFVPLRELHGRNIEDALLEIGRHCGYQQDGIVQTVNDHERDTLFIMDGLDEVNSKDRQEILKLLYRKTYYDATVVVTCRTGLHEFRKDELTEEFGLSTMSQKFSDKHILILGIKSHVDKQRYLKKFLPNPAVKDIVERLSGQLEILDSPLFLMLLPVILEEDKNIGQVSTTIEFFKKLFNCSIRHSYMKRQKQINVDFDLFHLNGPLSFIQKQMRDFGMLSLQKILQTELNFASDDLTDEIYQLGFLLNHTEMKWFSSENHYEGLHLSIMEFAAAFGLYVDITFNKTDAATEKHLQEIVNHFLDDNHTSLVLPFLAGLMQENLDDLLSQIKSFSAWFSLWFELPDQLISECSTQNIRKSKCLIDFIPSKVNLSDQWRPLPVFHASTSTRRCLQFGSKCGKIKYIMINVHTPPDWFLDETASSDESTNEIEACVLLVLDNDSYTFGRFGANKVYLTLFSNVPCKEPKSFLHEYREKDAIFYDCLLDAARLPTTESCELIIRNSWAANTLFRYMDLDLTLIEIKYRYFEVAIDTQLSLNVITYLLETNQVKFLTIGIKHKVPNVSTFVGFFEELDTSSFSRAAGQSTYLTSLRIVTNASIDLYDLTDGGKKKYVQFSVEGDCELTCRQPTSFKNCFSSLKIQRLDNIELITAKEPVILDCCAMEMTNFLNRFNANEYWFCEWINLQTLCIESMVENQDTEMLAKCILTLPIEELIIHAYDTNKLMNDMTADRIDCRLTTIGLIKFDFTESPELSELIKGLERNHWNKVNLVGEYSSLHVLRKMLSNFNVTPNTDVEYMERIFIPLREHYYSRWNILSITRK